MHLSTPRMARLLILALLATIGVRPLCRAEWNATKVLQMDGESVALELPAQQQIVTETWNRVVAVPYIAYMPEKDRICMLVSCDYPHQPMVLFSDDRGATWGKPRPVSPDPAVNAAAGLGTALTYLGEGRLMLAAGGWWFSEDYGDTWKGPFPIEPASNGQPWYTWDPVFVDRDAAAGDVKRLIDTGYNWEGGGHGSPTGYQQAFLRFSTDGGRTWGNEIRVPQWHGVSEVALVRAKNGNIVAACRTDMARQYLGNIDHYEGLGICHSNDDGKTWSNVDRLYDYGRHHPCLVLLPDDSILMTYVVRLGCPRDAEGFPQFGIEAVLSHDHGASWDLRHRYILAKWSGNRTGTNEWWPSSQATSTILLPDGYLLTAFGTGYRSQPNAKGQSTPRDVGLIRWCVGRTKSEAHSINLKPAERESLQDVANTPTLEEHHLTRNIRIRQKVFEKTLECDNLEIPDALRVKLERYQTMSVEEKKQLQAELAELVPEVGEVRKLVDMLSNAHHEVEPSSSTGRRSTP